MAIAVVEMVVTGAPKSESREPHCLSFLEKTEQSTEELNSLQLCPRVMGPGGSAMGLECQDSVGQTLLHSRGAGQGA